MKLILSTFATLALIVPATAQTASFTAYGSACKVSALSVTGTPKLNSTFTVSGMQSPIRCTLRFCQNCNDFCNSCGLGSILGLGLKRVNVPFFPSGCRLLTDAVLGQVGWGATTQGSISFKVPNDVTLLGQKFTMQRADLSYRGTNGGCNPAVKAFGFFGMSNGVEGLIGK